MTQQRPAKRIKFDEQLVSAPDDAQTANINADTVGTSARPTASGASVQTDVHLPNTLVKRKRHQSSQARPKGPSRVIRTFSQPSVLCTGDKGIFVTCDKGREQKSLLELHDLVQQYLEEADFHVSNDPAVREHPTIAEYPEQTQSRDQNDGAGIEDNIASELALLKSDGTKPGNTTHITKPIQLITLDIPCVSFLRILPGTTLDPVEIVHKLCLSATDSSHPQKSRYIKRLTPISKLAKALSQGLEKICEDVLPEHFGPGEDGQVRSRSFAIRPTIRNNDKLDRNVVIKHVATRVEELGQGQHKVDLKKYEKGVLVEVYRGWVGICVVDNTTIETYGKGFEELKRFNLAEIYASR